VNRLPDWLRVWLGRGLVRLVKLFKLAELPTVAELTADNADEVAQAIQAYMDLGDFEGKRGGWRAGKRALDAARKPGEILFTTPNWLLITLVMGLPGAPAAASDVQSLIDRLRQQYLETGKPDYLFNHAVAEATRQLREIDSGDAWFAGILQKMFDARKDPSLGWRARELAVLTAFKQKPEYVKFLTVSADGSLSLPRGDSYEEFAASMLTNAYGVYPF
jgi:hypothetical protein